MISFLFMTVIEPLLWILVFFHGFFVIFGIIFMSWRKQEFLMTQFLFMRKIKKNKNDIGTQFPERQIYLYDNI